ncbi:MULTISPECIES: hypothetical protein [Microcystis]|nr:MULTISPECIES: hypothetical protein [Microcystis]MCA2721562.1 hypothetical protein [Microcystis sp. M176S2]MCA2802114.1 hypothetical protein [Microcystis sp. M113S2]MCA2908467.1 hypothetical protein [Microcystis sp. M034S1]
MHDYLPGKQEGYTTTTESLPALFEQLLLLTISERKSQIGDAPGYACYE